jgi:predicted GIY-YIG superfamily endonuclease
MDLMDIECYELKNISKGIVPVPDSKASDVFYLLKIRDLDEKVQKYKFGITGDIKRRLSEHERNFDFDLIGYWKFKAQNIAKDLETKVKEFTKQNNIQSTYDVPYGKANLTEIFVVNNNYTIDFVYKLIDKMAYEAEYHFNNK